MMLSLQVIKDVLNTFTPYHRGLENIYEALPATRCQRTADCCSMLPEMTLIEALAAIDRLVRMNSPERKEITQKLVGYFLLNPVEIPGCPFLSGRDCLIYEDRFFGCRAYGLWSKEHYGKLSASSRHAREYIRKQWAQLGVSLPEDILQFQVPYCSRVTIDAGPQVDDSMLLHVSEKIEKLSQSFQQWHQSFRQTYFSDLGFLTAALLYGMNDAVRMKYQVVRGITQSGSRKNANRIIQDVQDIFKDLSQSML